MKYLFDTNVCIFIAKKNHPLLHERLETLAEGDAAMSVVSYCELMFGAHKTKRVVPNIRTLNRLVEAIPVLPIFPEIAHRYGHIRKTLELQGNPLGSLDLLIAAHALALKLTVVSNNVREFGRVESLPVEDLC